MIFLQGVCVRLVDGDVQTGWMRRITLWRTSSWEISSGPHRPSGLRDEPSSISWTRPPKTTACLSSVSFSLYLSSLLNVSLLLEIRVST